MRQPLAKGPSADPGYLESEVEIDIDSALHPGVLTLPRGASATVVVFAHGSGSSRLSPRNRYVARILQESGFGTLLFDLLTGEEDELYENRFEIGLLARRLAQATDWLTRTGRGLGVAYFGASTGAAAALQASVGRPEIRAVVSRGGRPDLAWDHLARVTAPTLLIVGGRDEEVLELNRLALGRLNAKDKELVVVPGATHLFEEPGTLEKAAKAATDWFLKFAR